MAIAAMPFVHPRAAEQGKKEQAKDRAAQASKTGKFATPPTPPKLVVNNA
jgi:phage terminase small subunit